MTKMKMKMKMKMMIVVMNELDFIHDSESNSIGSLSIRYTYTIEGRDFNSD